MPPIPSWVSEALQRFSGRKVRGKGGALEAYWRLTVDGIPLLGNSHMQQSTVVRCGCADEWRENRCSGPTKGSAAQTRGHPQRATASRVALDFRIGTPQAARGAQLADATKRARASPIENA
jgi:hypothetical protein